MAYYSQGHFNVATDPEIAPHWPFFIEGTGLERRVLATDIGRYLGDGAVVSRGTYQGRQGFFYTGYRLLTPAQVASLKEDSYSYAAERDRNRQQDYHYTQSRAFRESRSRQAQSTEYPPVSTGRGGPPDHVVPTSGGPYGYPPTSTAPVYAPTHAYPGPMGADPNYYYTESGRPFYNTATREYMAPYVPPPPTTETFSRPEVEESSRPPPRERQGSRYRSLPPLGVNIERTSGGYVGYFWDEGGEVKWVGTPGLPLGLVTHEYLENLRDVL
ncbi:hypothetical protein EX30DRAFT_161431 [Ascodesmis nigricans]|uniref:Uncharacterized protein n=1 Tax=Ascodesmis nigricans TaxID=341454 RepID=A0A4S2MML0_9PEZI|nr:hypothetical protein EX30DRAFT_161431 [Ascodesmis nigricans]